MSCGEYGGQIRWGAPQSLDTLPLRVPVFEKNCYFNYTTVMFRKNYR